MSKPKNRTRKHISISDLYIKYSTHEAQMAFRLYNFPEKLEAVLIQQHYVQEKWIMQCQRNDIYGTAEHDEIYIVAPSKNGKRGLGTDKRLVFVNLGSENNIYPTYLRLDSGEKHTTEATMVSLKKCVNVGTRLKTDGKTSYPGLTSEYIVESEINKWLWSEAWSLALVEHNNI